MRTPTSASEWTRQATTPLRTQKLSTTAKPPLALMHTSANNESDGFEASTHHGAQSRNLARSTIHGRRLRPSIPTHQLGRRAMLVPILIYAVLVEGVFRSTFDYLRWQPVVATILGGMQMTLALLVCFFWWRRSVRHVPAYLLFRLLRSYFTIGAVLSLVFPPLEPRLHRPPLNRRQSSSTSGVSGPAEK